MRDCSSLFLPKESSNVTIRLQISIIYKYRKMCRLNWLFPYDSKKLIDESTDDSFFLSIKKSVSAINYIKYKTYSHRGWYGYPKLIFKDKKNKIMFFQGWRSIYFKKMDPYPYLLRTWFYIHLKKIVRIEII